MRAGFLRRADRPRDETGALARVDSRVLRLQQQLVEADALASERLRIIKALRGKERELVAEIEDLLSLVRAGQAEDRCIDCAASHGACGCGCHHASKTARVQLAARIVDRERRLSSHRRRSA